MREVAQFIVGSEAFFGGMPGFTPHDHDILFIMDEWDYPGKSAIIRKDGKDMFLYPDKGLRLIDECVRQNDPFTAGKFLVPEFCEYIGATVSDIKPLCSLFERMDDKHRYETYIYKQYISNNGFFLTEEQLAEAFSIYLKARTGSATASLPSPRTSSPQDPT